MVLFIETFTFSINLLGYDKKPPITVKWKKTDDKSPMTKFIFLLFSIQLPIFNQNIGNLIFYNWKYLNIKGFSSDYSLLHSIKKCTCII